MRLLSETDGLTASDVMHRQLTSLPATATVGDLRAYFAASGSRRLALVVEDDTRAYVGAIVPTTIPATADDHEPAAAYATADPRVAPHAPAGAARDLAIEHPSLRVPVVDDAGTLVGIVAITRNREGFCGT